MAMQANVPQPNNDEDETDDVDEDLQKLQIMCQGGGGGGHDVTEDPSISDYLQYYKWVFGHLFSYSISMSHVLFRPKRFGLKSYKRLYFVCKNLYLLAYKSADAARKSGELLFSVHLKGCEVTPALNLTANKFEVKLEVPSAEGMTEMFLKFISVSHFFQLQIIIFNKCCIRNINMPNGLQLVDLQRREKLWLTRDLMLK